MENPSLLEMRGIAKRFGDVQANDGVDLTLKCGDILGLLGTAKYANHAKENAAERGWAGLTAGNGERDRTSFRVTPSVLLQAILCQENQDLWGCSAEGTKAAEDCRTPRRYREVLMPWKVRKLLECGSPLPLFHRIRRPQLRTVLFQVLQRPPKISKRSIKRPVFLVPLRNPW